MKTVHIVGGFESYAIMFEQQGWLVVDCLDDADLVQFCGGEDIWPGFYKEKSNPKTRINLKRDTYERAIWEMAVKQGIAIAGICRGAQFVHAMNGGSLYQHVNNHSLRNGHYVQFQVKNYRNLAFTEFTCSSTHHQMMKPGVGIVILAAQGLATMKQGAAAWDLKASKHYEMDVEAVYHPKTNSFCYQPHPEYFKSKHPCRIIYFQLLKRLLFPKKKGKNK